MIKLKRLYTNYFHDGVYLYNEIDLFTNDHINEWIIIIKNNKKIEEYARITDIITKNVVKYYGGKQIDEYKDYFRILDQNESKIRFDFFNKTAIFLYEKPSSFL